MSDYWQVVHDGLSMPMLQSPAGKIYRIQSLENGQWDHDPFEPGTSLVWVEALNLFRAVNAEQARQEEQNCGQRIEISS